MTRSRSRASRAIVFALGGAVLAGAPAAAGNPVTRTLVPIGSDYQPDTMQLLATQAVAHDTDGTVRILVIPITYGTDAYVTKSGERNQNETLAQARTDLMQAACEVVAPMTKTCAAQMVPVLVRDDAYLAANLAAFDTPVDGMFVLGGDQTIAMQVVAGTPFEARMATAWNQGTPMGGNSAGDAVQSQTMINGYFTGYGPATSMRRNAVDVWTYDGSGAESDLTRGLIFGFPDVIMDQHVFEYGRTGRSLNVALQYNQVLLGMDAATGAVVRDYRTLSDVTGDTSGYVIDPLTYGATGAWRGPSATLSMRRVALSLLAPGTDGYDFAARVPTVAGVAQAAPSIGGRSYPAFTTPKGAGPLLLAGGIMDSPSGIVAQRFKALAGGEQAKLVVLALGYARSTDAQADAKALAAALQAGTTASVQWFVVDGKTSASTIANAIKGATGIVVTAPDRALVGPALAAQATVVNAVKSRWTAGKVLLADNAAAAALGGTYIADGISADVEVSAPEDMLQAGVTVATGLGWVANLDVQPRLLPDQSWPQLFRLVAARKTSLGAGLDLDTALEISGGTAVARGASAAVIVDGRKAAFGVGTNTSLSARWMVLDSFTDGETVAP